MTAAFPNTFLIGVQKAGTTSLDNWLSQHPEIYNYQSLKDIHLFGLYKNKNEIIERLQKEQVDLYSGEKIVLQSAVNYIFYPAMLSDIKRDAPGSKIIIVLRNPVDRAVSSFYYFKKMFREKRPIKEALMYTPGKNYPFSKDNNDFTYIEHGFYYQQLSTCFQYFDKENILILDFEVMKKNPGEVMKKVFTFLNVDAAFQPDFSTKNITGEIRNKWFQKQLVKNSGVKKWAMKYLVNSWMPAKKRNLLKRKMFEKNTVVKTGAQKVTHQREELPGSIRNFLVEQYKNDVASLDKLLGTNYYNEWLDRTDENEQKT
ncbi:MAG: sulfotransferase domain-containing protein [Chitinophagaceae bacterium]